MELNNEILKKIKENNNFITTSQIKDIGISKTTITNYVKNGLLDRVRHGVYALPNSDCDDMYILTLSTDKFVFSHDTALFLNGISDRTPFLHTVTVPSNIKLPKSIESDCVCYYIKPELFQVGVIEVKNTFGNLVKVYNAERTICDLLRSRNRCDEETVVSAVKNYAKLKDKDLNLLYAYSIQFNVTKEIKRYLEVLL